jgi:hypothetical protein
MSPLGQVLPGGVRPLCPLTPSLNTPLAEDLLWWILSLEWTEHLNSQNGLLSLFLFNRLTSKKDLCPKKCAP